MGLRWRYAKPGTEVRVGGSGVAGQQPGQRRVGGESGGGRPGRGLLALSSLLSPRPAPHTPPHQVA
eukprot:3385134-Rhodomonas_salina.3